MHICANTYTYEQMTMPTDNKNRFQVQKRCPSTQIQLRPHSLICKVHGFVTHGIGYVPVQFLCGYERLTRPNHAENTLSR